jgi:hypothetical protein
MNGWMSFHHDKVEFRCAPCNHVDRAVLVELARGSCVPSLARTEEEQTEGTGAA